MVLYPVAAQATDNFASHLWGICSCVEFCDALCTCKLGAAKFGESALQNKPLMVDNPTEKIDECPLIGVVEYCSVQMGSQKLSVTWSSGVSAFQGLLKYYVGVFSELYFAVHWQGRLSRGYIVLWVTVLICQVVNSSGDGGQSYSKDRRVSTNRGCWVLLAYNWHRKNCPLDGVARCLVFRGCLSIKVNGMTVGTFQNCPLYHGCPVFRGVR